MKYKKCKAVTTLSQTKLRSFSRRFEQFLNSTRFKHESLWVIWQDIKWINMKNLFQENEESQKILESIKSDILKSSDWIITSTAIF